ncbi:nitrogenase molybdenum-cofactor biosynthesis protein NifE, partial [Bradyrhizobium sp. WBOS16]|nr:nitrogenase molybdenum-cofactor biosynthesis protein NifE [Bradyrhizobium sp. WBOS16]
MSSLNAKNKDAFHALASERSGSKLPKARRRNCARPMAPGTAVGGCAFD